MYSFLCKVDDANGISSLQSLDLVPLVPVQVRSISLSKQAIFTRENVRRNIQLAEAICEKQSPKEI